MWTCGRIRYLFGVLAVVVLPPHADAQDRWATVFESATGMIISADTASERKTSNGWEVWVRWDLSKASDEKPAGAEYNIQRTHFDCTAGRVAVTQATFYDAKGNVLQSSSGDTTPTWSAPAPESYGEAVFRWVCANGAWLNGTELPTQNALEESGPMKTVRATLCADAKEPKIKTLCAAWKRGPIIAPGQKTATPPAVVRWIKVRAALDSALLASP